jgi:transcription antitermination factor NusG
MRWEHRLGVKGRELAPTDFGGVMLTAIPCQHARDFPWFAVRVKSNFEKSVATSFLNKGLDVFLPAYKSRRRWSDRCQTIDFPLFPGYVFCRVDLNHRLSVMTTPGFLYIVGAGQTPTAVDEVEIARLQEIARSGLPSLPCRAMVGQTVLLNNGPLSGLEGILLRVGKENRVYVGVTLLRRGVSVEVDLEWILPIGPPQAADSNPEPLSSVVKCATAQQQRSIVN